MVAYRSTRRSRPTYRRTRRKLTATRVKTGSSSARVQKAQIATLARKTNRLSKAIAQTRVYGQFGTRNTNRTLPSPWVIAECHPRKSSRDPIFNDQTAIDNAKGFKFTKFNMDFLIQPYNESSVIDMTVFLVSLQPSVAKKVHIDTTLMTNLVDQQDYYSVANSLVMLNTKRFKIHYVKRCQTFENYTDGTPQTRGFHRGYLKRQCNMPILNQAGNWTDVDDTEWPLEHRMYWIVFNNNSSVDLEYPTLSFNCVWSGHTCAY